MVRELESGKTAHETAELARARRWWFWDRLAYAIIWFAMGLWTLFIIIPSDSHSRGFRLGAFIAGLAMIGMTIAVILEIVANVIAWLRTSRALGARITGDDGGAR